MKRPGEYLMKCRSIFSALALLLLFLSTSFAVTVQDVAYSTRNAGKVVFSHGNHLNKKGNAKNCRACHDEIYDLKNKKQYSMLDMSKGKSCGACHDGKKAFTLKECIRCHQTRDIVYAVKSTGPTGFSHKRHLATFPDCSVCHPSLFVAGSKKHRTMSDMATGKSSGFCHNGKSAFGLDSCITCHPVREITYKIKETGPTHFSHKFHIEVATCTACHPKLYAPNQKNRRVGMAAMEKGMSCGACHNGKQAFSVKECSKCHPTADVLFEDKSAGNVVFSHKFHTSLYTCGDCHSSTYKTNRSTVKVTMQKMEDGKSCGGCHDGKTAFSVKEKCESCHHM